MNTETQDAMPHTPWFLNRVIIIAPSIKLAQALQKGLARKMDQGELLDWQAVRDNPDVYTNKSQPVFVEADDHLEASTKLGKGASFFPAELFFISNDGRWVALRDRSGYKWGDRPNGITSAQVLDQIKVAV